MTSETDWEGRYQTGDIPWEKGQPSPGLVDFLKTLTPAPQTVLVPGCGTGHDVRAWAKAGFRAHGMDVAPSAIRLAKERTPPELNCRYVLGDFLKDDPTEQFDWIFEHTLFCAIDPAERDAYVKAVLRWLESGGQFLAVHYLIPDKDGPPFGTTREEIIQRFGPHLKLERDWMPRSYPNRTGLERMFLWRR